MSAQYIEPMEARRLMADTLSAGITLSKTFQTIDAIGGAANSGYQLPEYRQAGYFNKVFGDLGLSAVRSALDPGWELTNDNKDPNVINWAGFKDGAIANTMEFFKQAKARGVKTFMLSFWSPSAWMKTNKAARQGGQLRPDLRDEYAEYITAALLRAHDKWGVDITHISIANEPWFTEPYPSTMWTPQELTNTIKVVAKHLTAAGLTKVQITGPEDVSSLYRVKKYATTIAADPEANAEYPIIGTHYLNDQDAQSLAQTAAGLGKKIWYTEAGNGTPDFAGAMGLARGVDSAFVRAGATAWLNWQISGNTAFEALMHGQTPNPKYYALKQFAHFIKPGYQRVDVHYTGDAVRVSAYKNPLTGNLTVVMSNNKTAAVTINLSLSGGTIPATFEQFRTSATENCVRLANIAGKAGMVVTLPAGSIVTLYSGPDAAALTNTTAASFVPVPQYDDAWNTNDLRRAAMLGNYDLVKQLVDGGANVNAAFVNGWTPLFTAASSPYNKADLILNYFIQHGADVQHRDVEGFTALHVAAMSEIPAFGTVDTIAAQRVKLLLAAGVNVNALDGLGRTALMYAAMLPKLGGDFGAADTSVLQALLDAGANKSIKDVSGKTALDYAKAEKATDAINLLAASPPPPTGTASIHAYVINDKNNDGKWSSGEVGIAGRTVWIDSNGDGLLDAGEKTATTTTAGSFDFTGLAAGTFSVRQILPSGWKQTYPAAALVITLIDGQAKSGNSLGTTMV